VIKMMRYIRRLIYRLGFEPKPGSVFFSPSLNLLPSDEARLMTEHWMQNASNRSLPAPATEPPPPFPQPSKYDVAREVNVLLSIKPQNEEDRRYYVRDAIALLIEVLGIPSDANRAILENLLEVENKYRKR